MDVATDPWWEGELAGCAFVDARLGHRLRRLIERMGGAIGASVPLACQDWANTKAAYRFFANERVTEEQILAGHRRATRGRCAATDGVLLVVQDTTEFTSSGVSAPRRSASPTASTAAGTEPAGSGCTRSAGCSCTPPSW